MIDIFLMVGEASGDQLGSLLMQSILEQTPNTTFKGVGGPLMTELGLDSIIPIQELQVMGFTDVVRALPKIAGHFFKIRDVILKNKPDLVILIDYPGFNLRLAKSLRKKGYEGKIIQYVSPTVWAHGKERVQHLAKTVDLLLSIYPFEKDYYSETDLPVEYIGHPLVEHVAEYEYTPDWHKESGLKTTDGLLAIFPGSRLSELRHNFYNQLLTAQKLQEMHPGIPIAISCANENLRPIIEAKLSKWKRRFLLEPVIVAPHFRHDLMQDCQAAIAVSGTVTLELALHEKPTLVLYHVTTLNRLFARYILGLNLTQYCIVNIISERNLFPELILHPFRLPTAYSYLESLYTEGAIRRRCQAGCRSVKARLDGHGSHSHAAQAVIKLANQ